MCVCVCDTDRPQMLGLYGRVTSSGVVYTHMVHKHMLGREYSCTIMYFF